MVHGILPNLWSLTCCFVLPCMTSCWAQPWVLHVEQISYRKKLALLCVFERTVIFRNTRNVSPSLNRYWKWISIIEGVFLQNDLCLHRNRSAIPHQSQFSSDPKGTHLVPGQPSATQWRLGWRKEEGQSEQVKR